MTAFLFSDEAAYITGQTIFVDGGLTLFADFRTHVVARSDRTHGRADGARRPTAVVAVALRRRRPGRRAERDRRRPVLGAASTRSRGPRVTTSPTCSTPTSPAFPGRTSAAAHDDCPT